MTRKWRNGARVLSFCVTAALWRTGGNDAASFAELAISAAAPAAMDSYSRGHRPRCGRFRGDAHRQTVDLPHLRYHHRSHCRKDTVTGFGMRVRFTLNDATSSVCNSYS